MTAIELIIKKERKVIFQLAGFEDKSYVGQIVSQICSKNYLENYVQVLGAISGSIQIEIFLASDIFILPSYSEDLSDTVLEAMAASLIVIASDVGAIPELIEDGTNGFLIKAGDCNGLVEKLSQLIEDRNLIRVMGKNNRKKIEHSYDFEIIANIVEKE